MPSRRIRWDRSQGRPEPIEALNRVLERDNGEPLVCLTSAAPKVKVMRPGTIPWVRAQVAELLYRATTYLPDEYGIGVTDAWRPYERQRIIYDFMYQSAKEAFPNWSHAQLRRKVLRWVAPVDQKAPPGHCTGAAVDVNLIRVETGEPVDVSAPYERFQAAPTFTYGLDPEAKRHRMMLYRAMTEAGFSNCRDEWWHYSYGDAGWAVRTGLSECFYGRVELPPEEFAEQQRLWEEAFRERENPFLPSEG